MQFCFIRSSLTGLHFPSTCFALVLHRQPIRTEYPNHTVFSLDLQLHISDEWFTSGTLTSCNDEHDRPNVAQYIYILWKLHEPNNWIVFFQFPTFLFQTTNTNRVSKSYSVLIGWFWERAIKLVLRNYSSVIPDIINWLVSACESLTL
jgi:hypothetical protein